MNISIIAALDELGGLGKENQLLWRIPDDLKHFKKLTMGHCVLLGRKTFESIGRALPGRTLLVLTTKKSLGLASDEEGVIQVSSVEEALQWAKKRGESELMVAGGAAVYEELLPLAETLYLTRIHGKKEADAFFPCFKNEDWELLQVDQYDAQKNWPSWSFQILKRRGNHTLSASSSVSR
jgi:dihydrofolate reductase